MDHSLTDRRKPLTKHPSTFLYIDQNTMQQQPQWNRAIAWILGLSFARARPSLSQVRNCKVMDGSSKVSQLLEKK